ncbi:hypothetical protein [Streptomyces sp. NBC_01240]|uniref:hypothetical protein n=1 Tax=Streptomyces sp. NBC_01240 TaxID=2903793 RepID=UPI002E0E6DB1|nr:hypothetical protein OG466_41220 [Streptomyces sp. NBC_01240]
MIATRFGASAPARLYASTTDTFDGDLDFIAVEYALNGEAVTLTVAEKICAARILTERGLPSREVAARVGSARETVAGWKANGWQQKGRAPERSAA